MSWSHLGVVAVLCLVACAPPPAAAVGAPEPPPGPPPCLPGEPTCRRLLAGERWPTLTAELARLLERAGPRRRHEVSLRYCVDPAGAVTSVTPEPGALPELARFAGEQVERWRFEAGPDATCGRRTFRYVVTADGRARTYRLHDGLVRGEPVLELPAARADALRRARIRTTTVVAIVCSDAAGEVKATLDAVDPPGRDDVARFVLDQLAGWRFDPDERAPGCTGQAFRFSVR